MKNPRGIFLIGLVAAMLLVWADEVVGQTTTETPPTATLTVGESITLGPGRDKNGILPLNDWVPLFFINMKYDDKEKPAYRYLKYLNFQVVSDPRGNEKLGYDNEGKPDFSDLTEFAIYEENDGEKSNGTLTWGSSLITTFSAQPGVTPGVYAEDTGGALNYIIKFDELSDPSLRKRFTTNGPEEGNWYIFCVRSSATWRAGLTMSVSVPVGTGAHGPIVMLDGDDQFPVDDKGEPLDTYDPDRKEDPFAPEVGYSSSFACFDITGSMTPQFAKGFVNSWVWPRKSYTTMAEHTRPRWDLWEGTNLINFQPSGFMDMRKLIPIDTWSALIGINLHVTGLPPLEGGGSGIHITSSESYDDPTVRPWASDLEEVNVVLTDIGGDPTGAEGNGGFNPKQGLKPIMLGMTTPADQAIYRDEGFNGIMVFDDTNENGEFDPPTENASGGITFIDRPLQRPRYSTSSGGIYGSFNNGSFPAWTWEYIPYPPGGGDPWWRMKMQFYGGYRRDGDTWVPEAYISPAPDGPVTSTMFYNDYFVVIHTDSGYKDISLSSGDGTGITPGADFRAFIEPRRFDAQTGNWDGGIYVSAQVPGILNGPWQNNALWQLLPDEPWWPDRTLQERNAKPNRVGIDVHDFSMVYSSDNQYATYNGIYYGTGGAFLYADEDVVGSIMYAFLGGTRTWFDQWMDPYQLNQAKFLNLHSVGVVGWQENVTTSLLGVPYFEVNRTVDFPFETTPFFSPTYDSMPRGPRSTFYPQPLSQPELPAYSTWPKLLTPGQYPRLSDWAATNRKSHILRQKIDIRSPYTPMLGFNLVGANDSVTNQTRQVFLDKIVVAFWGPDFTPEKLMALNSNGIDGSGVELFEDINGDGVLLTAPFSSVQFPFTDTPLELTALAWKDSPEPVDLDGDNLADDLDGDGVFDEKDYAWVLEIRPKNSWKLPYTDGTTAAAAGGTGGTGGGTGGGDEGDDEEKSLVLKSGTVSKTEPLLLDVRNMHAPTAKSKAVTNGGLNSGDDLILAVRTSDKLSRFEQFRVLVPATLPGRSVQQRDAGIQLLPRRTSASPQAYIKFNGEEGLGQEFIGNDTLVANIATKIYDLAPSRIKPNSATTPVLGLDCSTNREANSLATGTTGVGGQKAFSVTGATWTTDKYKGCWLVDSDFETFQITGNSATRLTLLSGQPQDGIWRIVESPTFLEQVIVEFYNANETIQDTSDTPTDTTTDTDTKKTKATTTAFSLVTDLKPLNLDQTISGVAIYRDNDADPRNRNGYFDEGIDIPVKLDAPPVLVGRAGEPETQVKFTFSSPGTDNWPLPMETQNRYRQIIPDTFGFSDTDPNTGAEFFIVIRTSSGLVEGRKFAAAIVSWGPNTPTEPDPDTFTVATSGTTSSEDYALFQEFPWVSRALGYVTIMRTPDTRYWMEGFKARQELDPSPYNWIRSSAVKSVTTSPMTAIKDLVSPTAVVIDSVSQSKIPTAILDPAGFNLVIRGSGFGSQPIVTLAGYVVTVNSSSDTVIDVTLKNDTSTSPQSPLILIVRNPDTGKETSRDDLLTLTTIATGKTPHIDHVTPVQGGPSIFPVTVVGTNFNQLPGIQVLFDQTVMTVQSVSTDGTSAVVNMPNGGLPHTGSMDVTVRNLSTVTANNTEDTIADGFTYINNPNTACPAATASFGTPLAKKLDVIRSFRDNVLLKTALGTAVVQVYYTMGPALASFVAEHAFAALAVRSVLTPIIWALSNPGLAVLLTLGVFLLSQLIRKRHLLQPVGRGVMRMQLRYQSAFVLCIVVLAMLPGMASAFFPFGAFNSNKDPNVPVYFRWAWSSMYDTNHDGDVQSSDEGIQITIQSGSSGFTDDEIEVVRDSFAIWGNIPTSYLVFDTTRTVPFASIDSILNLSSSGGTNTGTDTGTDTGTEDDKKKSVVAECNNLSRLYVCSAKGTKGSIDVETRAASTAIGYNFVALSSSIDGPCLTVLFTTLEDTVVSGVQVTGPQIVQACILINPSFRLASTPKDMLKSLMVHSIGHFVGINHTPLNNLDEMSYSGEMIPVESPAVALRDATGTLKLVGATPSMTNSLFLTDDGDGGYMEGNADLAPDDIAAASFLYPRGSQDNYFSISQRVYSHTSSPSLPSSPIPGAHVVAWCDADNDESTGRIPLFSTMAGLYNPEDPSSFDLKGLYKTLEALGGGLSPFNANYTITISPINESGYSYQAPSLVTTANLAFSGSTVTFSTLSTLFPSEVFHARVNSNYSESGNIINMDYRDLGTPLAYDQTRGMVVSTTTGDTLATMLPGIDPMFGDRGVCPFNVVVASSGVKSPLLPNVLRGFRDRVMLKTTVGTALVDAYYQSAPTMCRYLATHTSMLKLATGVFGWLEWSIQHALGLFMGISSLLLVGVATRRYVAVSRRA